jgi:hypothetical protein
VVPPDSAPPSAPAHGLYRGAGPVRVKPPGMMVPPATSQYCRSLL